MPGAIGARAGLSTTDADIDRPVAAVAASGRPAPVAHRQDPDTGDFHVEVGLAGWLAGGRALARRAPRG